MKKLTMILLVCIITVGYSVSAYAADWQWITSTDTNTFSFDKEKVSERQLLENTLYGQRMNIQKQNPEECLMNLCLISLLLMYCRE